MTYVFLSALAMYAMDIFMVQWRAFALGAIVLAALHVYGAMRERDTGALVGSHWL
jgi:hypothetical protein